MNYSKLSKQELIERLHDLQKKYDSLYASFELNLDAKENEKSVLEKLVYSSKELISSHDSTPDYHKLTKNMKEISGAKFAVLNIYDENSLDFTTVAFVGMNEKVKMSMSFLGFEVENKKWKHDPIREEKTRHSILTKFDSLKDIVGDVLPEKAISLIQRTFSLGKVYIVKVKKENRIFGDFTLIFTNNNEIFSSQLVELQAHLVGMFLDRHKSFRIINENEVKLRAITDAAQDAILTMDSNGLISFWNPAAERILGYSKEEAIGQNLHELIMPSRFAEEHYKAFPVFQKTGKGNAVGKTLDLNAKCKDGREISIQLSLSAINMNNSWHAVGIIRDTTEQKESETALKYREEKYRSLVESMIDGVYRTTPEGRFLEVNNGLVSILGYANKEELMGVDIKKQLYFNEEDRISDLEEEKAVFQLRKNDGQTIWVEDHGRKVKDEKDNIIYHEGVLRDVTDHKLALEEIKRKNEELGQLNSEKDRFFSIIAHDLKTPFNSIIGFSNLLVDIVNDKDYEEVEKISSLIQKSSHRAMDLLMNLMEWSRSQTGRIEFKPKQYDFDIIIDDILDLLNPSAEKKSINLVKQVDSDSLAIVDKDMISTVLRNLISNTIKFSFPESEIIISFKKMNGNIIISIKDTGVGIPKNRINKLFKIDENISTPGTQKEQGTGLGLILCKEFIDKHNGKIWVESSEGSGSNFIISIPE